MRAPTASRPHMPGYGILPTTEGMPVTTDDARRPVVFEGVAEVVPDHRLLPGLGGSPTRWTFPN